MRGKLLKVAGLKVGGIRLRIAFLKVEDER